MTSILLIGVKEEPEMRQGFGGRVVFFRPSSTIESARSFMKDADLFLLDGSFGEIACVNFFKWVAQNTSAYGIVVEKEYNASLCIAAINSGIICDHILLPADVRRYSEAWQKYQNCIHSERFCQRRI